MNEAALCRKMPVHKIAKVIFFSFLFLLIKSDIAMIKLTVASIKVSILFLDSVLFPLLMIGRELFQELTLENITRSLPGQNYFVISGA